MLLKLPQQQPAPLGKASQNHVFRYGLKNLSQTDLENALFLKNYSSTAACATLKPW